MMRKSKQQQKTFNNGRLSLEKAYADFNRFEALRSGNLKLSIEILNSSKDLARIDIDFNKIVTLEDVSRAKNQIARAVLIGQISDRAGECLIDQIRSIAIEISAKERAEKDREIKAAMEEIEQHVFPARLVTYKALTPNHQDFYKSNHPIFAQLLAQHDIEKLIEEADRMKSKAIDHSEQSQSKAKTPKSKNNRQSPNMMAQSSAPITIAEQSGAAVSLSECLENRQNEPLDVVALKTSVFEVKNGEAPVPKLPLKKHEDPRLTANGITELSFAHIPNKPIPPQVKRW